MSLAEKGSPISADSQSKESHQVTQDILMAEVRYGVVFGEMNEVFYAHLNRLLSFIWIASGAMTGGGLLSVLTKLEPSFVLPWTFFFFVLGAIAFSAQKAFKFSERAKNFRAAKSNFETLEGRGWEMSKTDLQKAITKFRKAAPSEGAWLAPLAYNRACEELGHSDFNTNVPIAAKVAWGMLKWA